MELGPAYTAAHPSFALRVGGFAPRHVAPHPYTGQRTLALARGPLVYCAEDADPANAWAPPHFRDVLISAASPVAEEQRRLRVAARPSRWDCSSSPPSGGVAVQNRDPQRKDGGDDEVEAEVEIEDHPYVALRTEAWVRDVSAWKEKRTGAQPGLDVSEEEGGEEKGTTEDDGGDRRELVFVPYYLRANRGGKGHMRVGLLRK